MYTVYRYTNMCWRWLSGSYVVAYQTGKVLYVSGHIPMTPEGVLLTGTVRSTWCCVGQNVVATAASTAATLTYHLSHVPGYNLCRVYLLLRI